MKLLASRWFISHSTELEKFYKMVIFLDRENNGQSVTRSTVIVETQPNLSNSDFLSV